MKIILTESQLGYVAAVNAGLVTEGLSSSMKKALATGAAATIMGLTGYSPQEKIDPIPTEQTTDAQRQEKIDALQNYMNEVAKLNGYNPNMLLVDAATFYDIAKKHNFPLYWLVGVAHKESCFGCAPRAQRTGSMFSQGCYDDGRNVCNFKGNPAESIEAYIRLIENDYLVNGVTLKDLLNNFVNKQNKRYASSTTYETDIRKCMNRFIKHCPEFDFATI